MKSNDSEDQQFEAEENEIILLLDSRYIHSTQCLYI